MATDSVLSVLAWAQERHDNSVQIASMKTGSARVGWQEDVAYWTAIIDALHDRDRMVTLLQDLHTFIRYARFELQPGESQFGDQFPRQGCADKRLAAIEAELSRHVMHAANT